MTPLASDSPLLSMTDADGTVTTDTVHTPILEVTVEEQAEQLSQEQAEQPLQDQECSYHDLFRIVLEDLVRVTHCHGCGMKKNVCFFGYVGQYCCKTCSRYYDLYDNGHYDTYSDDYDAEDTDRLPHSAIFCAWCNNDVYRLSFANSTRHHQWRCSQNSSGVYWPMGDYRRPCYNECIRTCPVIRIPNYNWW